MVATEPAREGTSREHARVSSILAVAAVAGAGTMTVELAAVRLLAPWFGTSQTVWTNVIAVVLLALSVGYLLGARLSRRPSPLFDLGRILCLAALFTGLSVPLSGPIAGWFVPANLGLEEAASVVLWGSLATSLCVFLPPALLLGAVAPLAVQAVQSSQQGTAGRAGGAVLCLSTLGSLVGVFGTSHLFLPSLGLAGTFILASGLLAVAGGLALGLARARPASAGLLVLSACGGAGAALGLGREHPELAPGTQLLAEGESPYQSVRVVEEATPSGPLRYLQVNEGFGSFQSVWQPRPGLLPEGYYYNFFALPLWWEARPRWDVLVLGLGAGTAVRVIEGAAPPGSELAFVGVELDPLVVTLAEQHMQLELEEEEVVAGVDARVALAGTSGLKDLVLLDCYANQVELPFHLCTVEFFREVRTRMKPQGWLALNLGGFRLEDPVVQAVAKTCARAFGNDVLITRVPRARNFVLFARRDGSVPKPSELPAGSDRTWPEELWSRFGPLALPSASRIVSPQGEGGRVLTDDRAPTEKLQAQSIRLARSHGEEG